MLTGNLVRLKFHRTKVVPQYLHGPDPQWLGCAEDLLDLYRNAIHHTRGEVEAEVLELLGDSPSTLIPQGFAKLLDDRCDYEVVAQKPPDEVREVAFRQSALHRASLAASRGRFHRDAVLQQTAAELGITTEDVERLLFADLKDEARILTFDDISAEHLLQRYNVALAQAVLLKSVGVEIKVMGEPPARLRQLFRAVRFRRLIATAHELPKNVILIRIDGPLSLFSATQKYGLQLALFLPTLLHCESFELKADLRWGPEKKPKTFELSSADGLQSHTADHGVYRPKEFEFFATNFRSAASDWTLDDEPAPINLSDGIWVPDFAITHRPSGKTIFLELFGYWRRVDLEKHHQRLHKQLPGRFLLVVSGQYRVDENDDELPPGIVFYKRTPSVEAILTAAAALAR